MNHGWVESLLNPGKWNILLWTHVRKELCSFQWINLIRRRCSVYYLRFTTSPIVLIWGFNLTRIIPTYTIYIYWFQIHEARFLVKSHPAEIRSTRARDFDIWCNAQPMSFFLEGNFNLSSIQFFNGLVQWASEKHLSTAPKKIRKLN